MVLDIWAEKGNDEDKYKTVVSVRISDRVTSTISDSKKRTKSIKKTPNSTQMLHVYDGTLYHSTRGGDTAWIYRNLNLRQPESTKK